MIYPVNPQTVARYRQAFTPSRAKADPTDAQDLLRYSGIAPVKESSGQKSWVHWRWTGANEVLRVSRVATGLKQLARDTNTAVVAISDINKAAYQEALRTGTLDMGALRGSFKIAHAADCILLLQTGKAQRGNDQPRDQLDLLEERYAGNYLKLRQLQDVRDRFPLNEKAKATYARLSLLKNRGGMTAEPLFVYERAYHRFIPVDLDLGGDNEFEDL